jgi:membrane protein
MKNRRLAVLLKETFGRFTEYGDLLAAGMSFYALLSMGPLLVIAVTVTGWLLGQHSARETALSMLNRATSPAVQDSAHALLDAAGKGSGKVAAVLAALMLLWAASRLFLQVQDALNLLWGVRVSAASSTHRAVTRVAVKRLVSFAMVLACGALLLATIVLQTATVALGQFLDALLDVHIFTSAFALVQESVLSIALSCVVFALVYRVLPDVRLRWRDVWVGALLTSTLMLAGTWLLGLYLWQVAPAQLEGAIGTVAVFMLWTYYQAQVFLLGAAFTRAWSCRSGVAPPPKPHAARIPESP